MDRIEEYLDDVPYVAAENAAARLNRGMVERPASWETLIATAQRVIGHYQNAGRDPDASVESFYEAPLSRPLTAAARILTAGAETVVRESEQADYVGDVSRLQANSLAWLASSAFAAAGNFASADAALQIANDIEERLALSPVWRVILSLLSPMRRGEVLDRATDQNEGVQAFLEAQNAFLNTGEHTQYQRSSVLFDTLLRQPWEPFAGAILRSCRLALRHQRRLSTTANLREYSTLSNEAAIRLANNGPTLLLPAQWRVIRGGLLQQRDNALITLPTSTGKTLLAQFALLSQALSDGGIGIFVAPYVAVVRQTIGGLRKLVQKTPVRILSSNDVANGLMPLNVAAPQILVLTPEALDALLGRALDIDQIRTAVFDEAHLLENGVRGARLEGLLTRFRLRQRAGGSCRLVLMSAVLDNAEMVREWLAVPETGYFEEDWRPTARRIGIWQQTGRLSYIYGPDPIRPAGATSITVLGSRSLPLVERMWSTEVYPAMKSQWLASYRNVAYLVDSLRADFRGPALVVCMTRRATRGVANALASRLGEVPFGPALENIAALIEAEGDSLRSLLRCVQHGVAYHNASVPPRIRAAIEDAVKAGELVAVASTTTLAEGADLPFRLTVLYDWLQGYGENQRPLSPLLFRNIAGRSGRAGHYVEGDTIIFENVLGNERYTQSAARGRALTDIVQSSPRLRSPMEDLASIDTKGVAAVYETAFVAAIAENPLLDNLDGQFTSAAFSPRVGYGHGLTSTLLDGRAKVLSGGLGGPIGVAASPIRLTEFGLAVLASGLSPDSARSVLEMLPTIPNDLDQAVASILSTCGTLPEQISPKLRELAAGKRKPFIVKRADLTTLSEVWRIGGSLREAFARLPSFLKSTRKERAEWLAGEDVPDWDSQFDQFLDFMEAGFGVFIPLVSRAILVLERFAVVGSQHEWNQIAQRFEARSDLDLVEEPELITT